MSIPKKTLEAVHERSKGVCEAMGPTCTLRATLHHHMKLKGMGGGRGSDNAVNLAHICTNCHVGIHADQPKGFMKKWTTSSWQEEGTNKNGKQIWK